MNPVVSIVIPTFNSAALLRQTLDSVLQQDYTNWECIIVDDLSSDSTQQISANYALKDKRFISLKRPETSPKGANACRNLGVEKSRADYIIFLDADDILAPQCLSGRLAAFKKHPNYDALIYSAQVFTQVGRWGALQNTDPDAMTSEAYAALFLSYKIAWQTTSPIWKKESLQKFKGFNQAFKRFQDVEFHTRLLLAGIQIKRVQQVDFYYRIPKEKSKYQDSKFLDIAYTAMLDYIKIFSAKAYGNSIFPVTKRRELLFKMINKVIMQQLIPKGQWHWVPKFVKVARTSGIVTKKQGQAILLFSFFKHYNLDKTKGFGGYRLYKWALKTSKLHKVT